MKGKKVRGISQVISTVAILMIIFAIAAIVSPWAFQLSQDVSGTTANQSIKEIECLNAAYDFDSSFSGDGVDYDFSGSSDYLSIKLVNTGLVNLYNFTIQATFNSSGDIIVRDYGINYTTQRSKSKPLGPGEYHQIGALIPGDDSGTLTHVRVVNDACPETYIELAL